MSLRLLRVLGVVTVTAVTLLVVLLPSLPSSAQKAAPASAASEAPPGYAGAETSKTCHAQQYEKFSQTISGQASSSRYASRASRSWRDLKGSELLDTSCRWPYKMTRREL